MAAADAAPAEIIGWQGHWSAQPQVAARMALRSDSVPMLLVAAARVGFPRPAGASANLFPGIVVAVAARLVDAAAVVGDPLVTAVALDCLVVVEVGVALLLLVGLL